MADKLTNKPIRGQGVGFDVWFKANVLDRLGRTLGTNMICKDIHSKDVVRPINSVGILFRDCNMMREGNDQNHGNGGSNCATGTPVCFVDIVTVFPAVFREVGIGNLALGANGQSCFILPLVQLGENPDLLNLMNEACANWVSQKKGGVAHDPSHVANAIASGMAAICFALSQEIVLNGKKPNSDRMRFLVEALYTLGITARSVAVFSPECRKIFTLLPYMANTADTFQSTLMSFVFDETPCQAIRAKQIGSSISRYFKHTGKNASFIDQNPVGLIGLLLVAPMLGSLITSDLETSEIINHIVGAINGAVTQITSDFKTTDFRALAQERNHLCQLIPSPLTRAIHIQNRQILRGIAVATKVPLVNPDLIDQIYDAVLGGQQNVAQAIGMEEHAEFVQSSDTLTLNGKPHLNYPVLIKTNRVKEDVGYSATYIPADPREWTGIRLQPGAVYLIEAKTLGIADFKTGQTAGQQNVANFRFTAGTELLKGEWPGYAATGMYYMPSTGRFVEADDHSQIDPNKPFEITSGSGGFTVTQDDDPVLAVDNNGQQDLTPLLCFKYCMVTITLVEHIPMAPPVIQKQITVVSSDMIKPKVTVDSDSGIMSCFSLSESLSGLKVSGSIRKATYGQHTWGRVTSSNLRNS